MLYVLVLVPKEKQAKKMRSWQDEQDAAQVNGGNF